MASKQPPPPQTTTTTTTPLSMSNPAKKRTPRDYKFIRLLGEGSFSSVYLAVEADVVVAPAVTATTTTTTATLDSSTVNANKIPDLSRDTSQSVVANSRRTEIRKYAIKVCQKSHIKRQGKQVAIMREKEIMNILNTNPSEHFIRLYCTFQDFERLFFVMSYAENGELLTYMLEHPLTLASVRDFTLQLVEALEHLHKLDIVHRDLKPENILLSKQFNLMISDFGSAQIYRTHPITHATIPTLNASLAPSDLPLFSPQISTLQSSSSSQPIISTPTPTQLNRAPQHDDDSCNKSHSSMIDANLANLSLRNEIVTERLLTPATTATNDAANRRNSFVGTAQYVSPEMLKNRQASNKSDLWALGVIIFQMITNIMPFDAPNEYLIYKKIQSLDYTFPDNFDQSARDLVNSLIKLEPLERLGADDNLKLEGYKSIRRHDFLSAHDNERSTPAVQLNLADSVKTTLHDTDLVDIDKIIPGLDETQMLRLLTDS